MGGQRGPALDSVAVNFTQDQLIRQVIQAGENMPSYGKNLTRRDDCSVAFLQNAASGGQAPGAGRFRALAFGGSGQNSSAVRPQVGHDPAIPSASNHGPFRPVTIACFLRHRSICEVGRVSAATIPSVISPWQLAAS